MSWRHYLFGFSGRLNRGPYWRGILVGLGFLLVGVAIALPYVVIEHPRASATHPSLSAFGIATIAAEGVLIVAYFVFAFALMVKRLHDRNKSAWWIVPFFLAPQILELIADPKRPLPVNVPIGLGLAMNLTVIVLSLWALVELGFLRGTVGDNRYGSDPLA